MIAAACRMELIKLRSVRSTWWLLAFFAVSMIGLGILTQSTLTPGIMSPAARAGFDPTHHGFTGAFIGEIVIGVFGVLAVTGEYSSGLIRATLAAVNRRGAAFAAKAAVVGAAALACSEVLAFVTFFAGEAALRSSVPHASLGQPGVARAVLLLGVYLFLIALTGVGLGALLRHGAAAIGVLLGLLFALPLVISALPHGQTIDKFLPEPPTAVKPLAGTLSPGAALAMTCLYAAVILGAGYWAFTRRDA